MSVDAEKRIIYCNDCRQQTNHWLLAAHSKVYSDEYFIEYRCALWLCAGCEAGTLITQFAPQGESKETESDGTPTYPESLFPERKESHLRRKIFVKLKPQLRKIYRESIDCFNGGSLILCTAGLRVLLEGICDDKRIKGKNLRDKIDNLQPLLPNKNIIKNLHHFRFTGNEAVHRLKAPERANTHLAIEVMEDLLNFLYELDYKASRLTKMGRKKREKTVPATNATP